jgi:2-oxoisovalerate dehydrogenase E1 component
MIFDRKQYSNERLVQIYQSILLPRMIEEKMLILLRQGKISKWFSGIGQEAIAVGTTLAMQSDEWVFPLHRNLGVFTTRNMPLHKLFMQWQGNQEGYSQGRERSFHFGTKEHAICGMISHLGPQLALADGAALAYKLKESSKAALAFTGEGGTSEGDFHEALNVAAVWDLPVIFIIENNGYGLSTPTNEQYRCANLIDRAKGYGMEGVQIDGNNILTVLDTLEGVRKYCIENQKPYLIECMTFRMRGHEEASGTKYVPPHLFELWKEKDPVVNYEKYLLQMGVLTETEITSIRETTKTHIEEELKIAFEANPVIANTKVEMAAVYQQPAPLPDTIRRIENASLHFQHTGLTTEKRMIDAIHDGLHAAMKTYDNLVLMGQDIAEYGGAFKITEGFVNEFGKTRVRNTPICESAILGAALGLSLVGMKSMVEMQFADFVSVGFNQIVNNLAKIHYRWGQNADVVVRMPTGGGVGAGPFHSQSNEAWFTKVPGLKIVYPSTPMDAKGLLMAAFHDPNPVLFFEHKALYRSVSGQVPDEVYAIEIGKARQVRVGEEIAIITYGSGVHWAEDYAAAHPEISIDILDLRSLAPLDYEAIRSSVQRTGRVLLLHEDTLFGGIGGEIAAWIGAHCFEYLDAPIMRCGSLDTPIPFHPILEENFLARSRLATTIQQLMEY